MLNNQKTSSVTTKIFSFFAHIIGALILLLGVLVLLIAVYHTLIVLIARAAPAFFLFVVPLVTLALCSEVIFSNHPVRSLLCLITVFFSTVLLYLYLGADFLAFLFLIVYVGAIAILFLFVIMLLHLQPVFEHRLKVAYMIAGPTVCIYALGLEDLLASSLGILLGNDMQYYPNIGTNETLVWFVNYRFLDILVFSNFLYTYHCFLFFVSSLLLLTAMLGAIILATSATDTEIKK